jgi:hypothetical protein
VAQHLGKVWDLIPWGADLDWVRRVEKDNVLGRVEKPALLSTADAIRSGLDDRAVLVLFSVFEATVRDLLAAQVRPEVEGLHHPAVRTAGERVLDAVAEGSFYQVLEPFKPSATADLVEQVNQVRRWRNWVAHGCRPEKRPENEVRPKDAYERLKAFLEVIRPPAPEALEADP